MYKIITLALLTAVLFLVGCSSFNFDRKQKASKYDIDTTELYLKKAKLQIEIEFGEKSVFDTE
jgi:PBP1b-binding outer membrane lipoprotein LpoB